MSYRAYQGAIGWYVAWESEDGCHRQPSYGNTLTRSQAERQARERNAAEQDDAEAQS